MFLSLENTGERRKKRREHIIFLALTTIFFASLVVIFLFNAEAVLGVLFSDTLMQKSFVTKKKQESVRMEVKGRSLFLEAESKLRVF